MNSRHLVDYNFIFFRDRRKICLVLIMHENTTPLHYITLRNIIEKWKNRPTAVCATGNLIRNDAYLLTIMTNNLFVIGTIEMLRRNSINLLNSTVSDIHNFSVDHNMRLNPIKCQEMLINFMSYPNFTLRPLVVDNNGIERVSTYKILGVFIDSDLKWNSNVEYIIKKLASFQVFKFSLYYNSLIQ